APTSWSLSPISYLPSPQQIGERNPQVVRVFIERLLQHLADRLFLRLKQVLQDVFQSVAQLLGHRPAKLSEPVDVEIRQTQVDTVHRRLRNEHGKSSHLVHFEARLYGKIR